MNPTLNKNGLTGRYLILAALWLVVIGCGFAVLVAEENTPGVPAMSATPTAVVAREVSEKPTLLLFLHPQCPCSESSISELIGIMRECGDRMNVHVAVFAAAGHVAEWKKTDVWKSVAEIPGIEMTADVNGALALQTGARTSGQTFLFGRHGALLFSGGITGARACAGENEAARALVSLIMKPDVRKNIVVRYPVFGCSLYPDLHAGPVLAGEPQ